MALQKEMDYRGNLCNYWRITSYSADLFESDSVIRLCLYKDEETRARDQGAVQFCYTFDLGRDFLTHTFPGTGGKMGPLILGELYTVLMEKAVAEAAKPDGPDGLVKDQNLAWFADAVEV